MFRRPSRPDAGPLQDELARLREENARLRVTAQRPLSLGQAADKLTESLGILVEHPAALADRDDRAVQARAEAMVIREQVLDALSALQTAAGQLERQLRTGLPVTEIDRRVARRPEAPSRDLRHEGADSRESHERRDRRGIRLHTTDQTTELKGIPA